MITPAATSGLADNPQALLAQLRDTGNLEVFQRGSGGTLEQQVRQLGVTSERWAVHVGRNDGALDSAVVADLGCFFSLGRTVSDARDDAPQRGGLGAEDGASTVVSNR